MEILSLSNYHIDRIKILSEVEIFSSLSSTVIKEISKNMDLIKINKGELLFQEEAQVDYIYFVFSGRLVAYKNNDDDDDNIRILGMISRGDSIGEMSLISSRQTVANVKATRQSLLIRLTKVQIEKVMTKHPSIARSLTEIILYRMEKLIKKSRNENILMNSINIVAIDIIS